MFQAFAGLLVAGLALAFCLFLLVLLPFLLIGAALELVFWIVTIPFRLLGFAVGALAAVLGLALEVVGVVLAAIVGVLAIGLGVVALPLIPLGLLALLVWVVVRALSGRSRSAPAPAR